MRVISSSFKRIEEIDTLKKIELIGRCCYKSEDKITDTSYKGFIKGICVRGHTSVLEHGSLYFTVEDRFEEILDVIELYEEITYEVIRPFMKYKWLEFGRAFVSTNVRVIYTLIHMDKTCLGKTMRDRLNLFLYELSNVYPYLFEIILLDEKLDSSSSYFGIYPEKNLIFPILARETFNIISDKGIHNELVRHRNMSFSAESTRYVDYQGEKVGTEITIVQSDTLLDDSLANLIYLQACKDAEERYFGMRDCGEKPQIARKVLPISIKTEMYMTGYLHDWLKVFKLRSHTTAHPEVRIISMGINNELNKVYGNKVVPYIQ